MKRVGFDASGEWTMEGYYEKPMGLEDMLQPLGSY